MKMGMRKELEDVAKEIGDVFKVIKIRAPWLLIGFILGFISGFVAGKYAF
jgi:Mg/Co/Ni transporter MgtE